MNEILVLAHVSLLPNRNRFKLSCGTSCILFSVWSSYDLELLKIFLWLYISVSHETVDIVDPLSGL